MKIIESSTSIQTNTCTVKEQLGTSYSAGSSLSGAQYKANRYFVSGAYFLFPDKKNLHSCLDY